MATHHSSLQAAILQDTTDYFNQLEQDNTESLISQLKRLINQHEGETNPAIKKRKTESGTEVTMTESSGEGLSPQIVAVGLILDGAGSVSPTLLDMDHERELRMNLDVRSLETQLYPERVHEVTQQDQLEDSQQQHPEDVSNLNYEDSEPESHDLHESSEMNPHELPVKNLNGIHINNEESADSLPRIIEINLTAYCRECKKVKQYQYIGKDCNCEFAVKPINTSEPPVVTATCLGCHEVFNFLPDSQEYFGCALHPDPELFMSVPCL